MPRNSHQRSFKYQCLDPQCSDMTVLDSKWPQHLEDSHPNCDPNEIKFVKVQFKIGSSGFWQTISVGNNDLWNNSFLSTTVPHVENGDQDYGSEPCSSQNTRDGSINRSIFLSDYNGEVDESNFSEETIPNVKSDAVFSNIPTMEIRPSSNGISSTIINHPMKSEFNANVEPNDPYLLIQQKINQTIITHHLKLGPMQPSPGDYHYPKTHRPTSDSLLCFNSTWFERKLTDGSSQPRPWLSYSKYLNRAFCIYCILFGNSAKVSESWTKTGWDTWNNGSRDIKRHEESPQHRAAELAKVKAISGFHNQHNFLFQISANSEVLENRKNVSTVINFIKHSASFQMTDGKASDNFMKIVHLVIRYDDTLARAMEKCRNHSDQELNLFSVQNQRRLASAISEAIAERLAMLVKRRRSYILILDVVSWQGSGDRDGYGLAVWIRYLAGDNANETRVVQSLLEVVTLTNDENIEEKVIRLLRRLGLDPSNMVTFCCYSVGPEMFLSQLSQVCGWPQNDNMLLFVLEAACTGCPRLSACLGLVQQVLTFWTGSISREKFLCEFLERETGTIVAKSLDEMVDLLVDRYEEMIDALAELRATIPLSALEAWIVDSLWRGLKGPDAEECVQLIRKLIGIMRPALTCQQLVRVHFLRQMKSRLRNELETLEKTVDNSPHAQMNESPPPRKILRVDVAIAGLVNHRQEYITFLSNVYRTIADNYSDFHLQLLSEIVHFSGTSLDDSNSDILGEHSISSVCQLAKVDSRSVVREMADFQPIYREHKSAVISCWPSKSPTNHSVFPGEDSLAFRQSPLSSDPFLTPLKLVTEFTSFPSLLTVYKMLAVLPITANSIWQAQTLTVRQCLRRTKGTIDEVQHCGLMLVSLENQEDYNSYVPEDPIIDKLASCSSSLRKALNLPR